MVSRDIILFNIEHDISDPLVKKLRYNRACSLGTITLSPVLRMSINIPHGRQVVRLADQMGTRCRDKLLVFKDSVENTIFYLKWAESIRTLVTKQSYQMLNMGRIKP